MLPPSDIVVERRGAAGLLVRAVTTLVHRGMARLRERPGGETHGVVALAITPDGRVVLVRHGYVRGWYLPGGGRKPDEAPEAAALRELREEVGLVAHGAVAPAGTFVLDRGGRTHHVALFRVEGVVLRPRLSLEIEAIGCFLPEALPEPLSPAAGRRICEWREGLAPAARW